MSITADKEPSDLICGLLFCVIVYGSYSLLKWSTFGSPGLCIGSVVDEWLSFW